MASLYRGLDETASSDGSGNEQGSSSPLWPPLGHHPPPCSGGVCTVEGGEHERDAGRWQFCCCDCIHKELEDSSGMKKQNHSHKITKRRGKNCRHFKSSLRMMIVQIVFVALHSTHHTHNRSQLCLPYDPI